MRILWIDFKFKWYEVLLIFLAMVLANIIAIPHWIMCKPRWSANLLNKMGQELFLFDIYKPHKEKK